jgi:uncharacterized protein (TIRG00374 family)
MIDDRKRRKSMKKSGTPNLGQIIKWLILVVVLALLINYLIQHSDEFHFLKKIRMEYILPVVLLNIIVLLLSCYRFDLMLTHVSHRIPHYTVFKYFIFGRFINRFIPYGGSVFRAIMFKKSDGVSYKKYIASNVSFDWLNLIYSTLFGVLVIGVYDPRLNIRSIPLLLIFATALVLLAIAIPLTKKALTHINSVVSAGSFQKRVQEITEIVDRVMDALRNRPIFFSNSIIISFVIGGNLISYYLLFKSIGVDINLTVLLVYLIILRFFKVLRITPANLGIQEFLLGFLSYSLGPGSAEGVAVSIMMRLVSLCVQGGLSGILFTAENVYRFFWHRES